MKKRRVIYNQNYYKAAAMVRDPWFKEKETWLKKRFTEVGCPLPKSGFKKYRQYLKWNDRYWKRYGEMEQSPEFKATTERITGGKERFPIEVYDALEKFRRDFLPPVYGTTFTEILRHFGINERDRGFRDFLEFYIFLNRKTYPESPFGITFVRNQKTREVEMFIQIFGHTKREDIVREWDWIVKEQKALPDFKGRNKEWKTFERDIEIYNLYKNLKDPIRKRRSNKQALDDEIFQTINERWPNMNLSHIRSIVTKTKKRLGEI